MFFGRKVDNPLRSNKLLPLRHKHAPNQHLTPLARCLIGFEIVRESLLEHESNASAHYTNGVDRIHQRVRVSVEQVSLSERDHRKYHRGLAARATSRLRFTHSSFKAEVTESLWATIPTTASIGMCLCTRASA